MRNYRWPEREQKKRITESAQNYRIGRGMTESTVTIFPDKLTPVSIPILIIFTLYITSSDVKRSVDADGVISSEM